MGPWGPRVRAPGLGGFEGGMWKGDPLSKERNLGPLSGL